MRARYTRAHKTAHRVIFESSSLLPDRATINVFSAVSRASSYYGSPLRCVISLKFCRFYADRIYRWPPASFFDAFAVYRAKASLYEWEKKYVYIYIYIFLIIVSNSKTYINEIKAKSPLEKLIALCNIYIYISILYFVFDRRISPFFFRVFILNFPIWYFSHDKRECKQKWVNNDDRFRWLKF